MRRPAGGGEWPRVDPAAAGPAGGRLLSSGGGRSRDASGERRRPAAGGEGTAGRRVATVTAAVTPRAGKDPVSTGSGAFLEAHNGGTGLSGASVSPATPEPLESRWDPFVTMTCVTGRKAAVTCVAFPALRRPGESAVLQSLSSSDPLRCFEAAGLTFPPISWPFPPKD